MVRSHIVAAAAALLLCLVRMPTPQEVLPRGSACMQLYQPTDSLHIMFFVP